MSRAKNASSITQSWRCDHKKWARYWFNKASNLKPQVGSTNHATSTNLDGTNKKDLVIYTCITSWLLTARRLSLFLLSNDLSGNFKRKKYVYSKECWTHHVGSTTKNSQKTDLAFFSKYKLIYLINLAPVHPLHTSNAGYQRGVQSEPGIGVRWSITGIAG